MTELGDAALRDLDGVAVPSWDRSAASAGIVHLGLGNFARSHLSHYQHDLMQQGRDLDWAICGVGTRPADESLHDALRKQDGLYSLTLVGTDGSREVAVLGSVVDHLQLPAEPADVVARLCDPRIGVATLTVTEGGYHLDSDGTFAPEDDVDADARRDQQPRTVFGILVEALRRRRDAGTEPLTVLSCDNLPGNGAAARSAVVGFAALRDRAIAAAIEDTVPFPNAMVDRITPAAGDEQRQWLREEFGFEDGAPVVAEPFRQWVIEDNFVAGRPAWEEAGAQLVPDVEPYEAYKLRLLNAGHQLVAHLGLLLGHRYVHEAAGDDDLAGLLDAYLTEEAIPTLPELPDMDGPGYAAVLRHRFANPEIADPLTRVAAQASARIPAFLLPVVRERLANRGDVRRSGLVVAAWACVAVGTDEHGAAIDVADELAGPVRDAARRAAHDPAAFLDLELFGRLGRDDRFREAVGTAGALIRERGVRAAVRATT